MRGVGDAEAQRAAVQAVDADGLEVRIAPSLEGAEAAGEVVRLSLVGQDRPGIVARVTGVLSGLDVNIETFATEVTAEPHSGAPLFHMDAGLRLPAGRTADEVQDALEAISAEVMVDLSLTAAA